MKLRLILAVFFSLFVAAPTFAATASTSLQKPLQQKTAVKKQIKKKPARPARKLKYVAPAQQDLQVESLPLVLPISEEAIAAFSRGRVGEAIRILRTEPPSSKSLHLIRAAQTIESFKKNRRIPAIDRHAFCQNLGVAYHNLFLFLKRNNIINKNFYSSAIGYYKKSTKGSSEAEISEAHLLMAALYAAYGNVELAQKTFVKVNIPLIGYDYAGLEYLATYYAAMGDKSASIEALKRAYILKPEQTAVWVRISDDFASIEGDSEFKGLTSGWEIPKIKEKSDLTPGQKKAKPRHRVKRVKKA